MGDEAYFGNSNSQKPANDSVSHKLGDKIERVGEKLKDKGAVNVGQKVYNIGNKIEHSKDKK